MTTATCIPISGLGHSQQRELRPDHLADLLECLADLVVQTGQQRRTLEPPTATSADTSTREAIRRLAALEESIKRVGLEAAAVHQRLQHEHLI
jgi:hypothetical protein